MKRTAAVLALTLLLGFIGARLLGGGGDGDSVVASGCDPATAIPETGMLSLAYTGPSAPPHVGHNDYVLGGRVRWDSQAALDCIGNDADAAYEHEITFDGDFTGRIWRLEHTFPDDAEVYTDESVNDRDGSTVLVIGVFRPEHLTAGIDYWFTLETPLLPQPDRATHEFVLDGEVADRICAAPNAWCVERSSVETRRTLIDDRFNFDVEVGGCWAWLGDDVTPCADGVDGRTTTDASPEDADDVSTASGGVDVDPDVVNPVPQPSEARSDPTSGSGDAESSPASGTLPSGPSVSASTTPAVSQLPGTPATTSTTNVPTTPGSTSIPRPGAPTTSTPALTSVPGTSTTVPSVTVPSSSTTIPSPSTTRPTIPPTPTTRPPAPTTTLAPSPTTTQPSVTTMPPTIPPTTTPPTTTPPTTTPPTTSPPAPTAPSFRNVSATSPRPGRIRVVARISWPGDASSTSCVTTLDGAVVDIRECGSRLNLNLRGVASGTHTVRVRACNQSVACTDSPTSSVTVG